MWNIFNWTGQGEDRLGCQEILETTTLLKALYLLPMKHCEVEEAELPQTVVVHHPDHTS